MCKWILLFIQKNAQSLTHIDFYDFCTGCLWWCDRERFFTNLSASEPLRMLKISSKLSKMAVERLESFTNFQIQLRKLESDSKWFIPFLSTSEQLRAHQHWLLYDSKPSCVNRLTTKCPVPNLYVLIHNRRIFSYCHQRPPLSLITVNHKNKDWTIEFWQNLFFSLLQSFLLNFKLKN